MEIRELTAQENDALIAYASTGDYAAYAEYAYGRLAEMYKRDALFGDVRTEDGRFAQAVSAQLYRIFDGFGDRIRAELEERRSNMEDLKAAGSPIY